MTFKTIMVHVDVETSATPQLKFGWELARRFEADLIVFAAAEANRIVPVGDNGIAAAEVMRQQLEEIEVRLRRLQQKVHDVTNDDPRVSWHGCIGDPTRLLALHARATDLIVVGSRSRDVPRSYRSVVDTGSLILSAGRPVLMVSHNLAPLRYENVVVAWKDTREARRAVVDAMPFLTKAQHVLVVTVEEDDPKGARESVADVVRFLTNHGVNVRSEVVDAGSSQAVAVLAQLASENGANLIVAGGYGHSRPREWAFGGMTRSLLNETSLHRLFSN
jgi:nucleotide-binding universal stress UspA family protein